MKAKIAYVVDYFLDEYNSVRDIVYNTVTLDSLAEYEHIFIKSGGHLCYPINTDYIQGYKSYSAPMAAIVNVLKSSRYCFFEKAAFCLKRAVLKISDILRFKKKYYLHESYKYFKTVIKKQKPDVVVVFNGIPNHCKQYTDVCIKTNTPYITILYDAYIDSPKIIDIEAAKKYESDVINHSKAYLVPSFFFDIYEKHYHSDKVLSYNLPLLIDKADVVRAYENFENKYNLTYFGQMQAFRNSEKVKSIFRELNLSMDIYSTESHSDDDVFRFHPAVTKDELYSIIAGSNYLVALDNSAPFNWFLPSKSYLYVSFTKPVIAFGDNENSALKKFFENYPWFYYQNLNEPLDGLKAFLEKEHISNFNNAVYSEYLQFSPEQALKPLVNLLNSIL